MSMNLLKNPSQHNYKDRLDKVVSTQDWLDLINDPNLDINSFSSFISNYEPGNYSFSKIGTVSGNWDFEITEKPVVQHFETQNEMYVLKNETEMWNHYGYDFGYDKHKIDATCLNIIEKLQFTDWSANINVQPTAHTMPLHMDFISCWVVENKDYSNILFDKALRQPKNTTPIHRVFVALSDWQPGWMFQFGVDHWTNWKKGDVVTFDWRNVPHATANAGFSPRPLLKITGFSTFIDNLNKPFSLSVN